MKHLYIKRGPARKRLGGSHSQRGVHHTFVDKSCGIGKYIYKFSHLNSDFYDCVGGPNHA